MDESFLLLLLSYALTPNPLPKAITNLTQIRRDPLFPRVAEAATLLGFEM